VSLLLLALLLFLLFGGSRIGAAGKGLGEAARHIKRAVNEDAAPSEPASPPEPAAPPVPTMTEAESKPPKLLPAKGESSASSEDFQA
jgi:Sec-independent protein translocase protein TatA